MNVENTATEPKKLSVYYDGLCHLCSREISHYRKMKGSEKIEFIDITSPSFQANQAGLDPLEIHKSLHAKDKIGKIHTGLDAFICIWDEIPALKPLAKIARLKPASFVLRKFYALFAKVRPMLPRKSCESSPYCEVATK